jgi:hypothetical protein
MLKEHYSLARSCQEVARMGYTQGLPTLIGVEQWRGLSRVRWLNVDYFV